MKDLNLRIQTNANSTNSQAPGFPHLATAYYRFGYIRLYIERNRRARTEG